ncbi:hypothetical protein PPL_10586 [Heterostelium album PN500]|uniref:Uncharacterized protein n=1 Tax=Heterostelium pallidum (strain ATCC 26659 / Pp 5 / PN500) TaxID=670386 RepID=D3BRH5_HETP5|nr:hypothetical protein PPL_10586 [Heterostelium album PN500]EFA76007.1 hypothetical protein PPL_10586 [Heterostelium album PN500]|eukprot:XP_020428141.1 hypothetical protein PPL_10586 [Heterostelium album PN500]
MMKYLLILFIAFVTLANSQLILSTGQWTKHNTGLCTTPLIMNLTKNVGGYQTVSVQGYPYLTNITVNNDGTFQGLGCLYSGKRVTDYASVKGVIYNANAFVAIYAPSFGFPGVTYYYSLNFCDNSNIQQNVEGDISSEPQL